MISGAHVTRLADLGAKCPEPFSASWGRATSIPLSGGGKIGLHVPRYKRPGPPTLEGKGVIP